MKRTNKACKNFNIYIQCIFFKKINKEKHLEISLFYTRVPEILMYSSWDDRVWQAEIGNYGSFCVLYHVYQKPQSYKLRFLQYGVRQTYFFAILGHVLHFYPSNNAMKKHPEISPFYTCVPKAKLKKKKKEKNTRRHHHFTLAYHKWQSYGVWFLGYGSQETELFAILDYFLPIYPPNNLENKHFEKIKENSGGTIILHKCTINKNHMFGSWDMERDRQKFFCYFGPLFAPLPH